MRVDFRLDRAELVAFDWAMMTEVEAQPLRRDHRSRLAHMSAKDFAQRGMDEMRRGVIPLDVAAARFVYLRQRGRRLERVAERPDHGILAVHLLDTFNRELPAFAFHHAGVADLATGFCVERILREDQLELVSSLTKRNRLGFRPRTHISNPLLRCLFLPLNPVVARDRLLCSVNARSNPGTSTFCPRSPAIICVRSSGKPYVS